MDASIRADRLTRVVNGKTIVRDVSFEVPQGELLGIVGPSGSGKSSLLRLLNRLDEPTGGTVYIKGEDYCSISPRDLRRRVAMVMQHAHLFPGTVAANVRFGPLQRGETLDDAAVESLLARVGLSDFAERSVDKLSGGEGQRVSIARSLANRPEVLLLDEPTSALDEALAIQVERLIEDIIRSEHLTCLWVTHNKAQALRIAGRVLVLEKGAVAAMGPAKEMMGASELAP